MKKTEVMKYREKKAHVIWKDEGGGYASGRGMYLSVLCYVALPKGHPCIGKDYDDLDVDVNGGLTFGNDNVFGWDYAHYQNSNDYDGDISRALKFFRAEEKK